jgi:hypothetical protein
MDRIELAERQFWRVSPDPTCHQPGLWSPEIEAWLRNDVVPCVDEFIDRPAFQERATWSLERLTPGSDSPERRAVEAADLALVESARALSRLAEHETVAGVLRALHPPKAIWTPPATHELGPDEGWVRRIAARPWTDLVCAEDYFQPRGGSMPGAPSSPTAATEWGLALVSNPELRPPGDFVIRCLFARIAILNDNLNAYRRRLQPALAEARGADPGLVEDVRRTSAALKTAIAALRTSCFGESRAASLRDSCIILTQVYEAFHPAPRLSWLPLPRATMALGPDEARTAIQRHHTVEPFDRIAVAISDLRWLEGDEPLGRARSAAIIAAGGLVVIDTPRAAYWEGEPLDVDWARYGKPWEFLRALVYKAQLRACVVERDLYGADSTGASTMANRFGALKRLVPASLWKYIVAVPPRSYRLELDPSAIHLLDSE